MILGNNVRFEVINYSKHGTDDQKGRLFVAHGVTVEVSYQDNDKTIKVFIEDAQEKEEKTDG